MDKFSFDTIKDFDNHINNSILGYSVLHDLLVNLTEFFIQKDNQMPVLDIGCTSGKLLQKISDRYPTLNCIGYDKTDHNFIQTTEKIKLVQADATKINFPKAQVIYSIFTLQFIPINYRESILRKIYNSLYQNGAFFFCEKEFAETAKLQEVYTFANYSNKKATFSSDEILQKEKDIRMLMSPLSSKENRKMLERVGFTRVDIFFKSLNFTGYICQK